MELFGHPYANSIVSIMCPRSQNWESLQANLHMLVFLPPVWKPNDLNVWFAMHVFHFSPPSVFEGNLCLGLDFLTCIPRGSRSCEMPEWLQRRCLPKTECRVLPGDGAGGGGGLYLTEMKAHASISRSTAPRALALDWDRTHADLKDGKKRRSLGINKNK